VNPKSVKIQSSCQYLFATAKLSSEKRKLLVNKERSLVGFTPGANLALLMPVYPF
jgi:hypothetical protein